MRLASAKGILCLSVLALATDASAQSKRKVALTFDDVPGVAMLRSERCNAKAYSAMNKRLIAGLSKHRIPATGLVTESQLCGSNDKELAATLELWLDAGLDLGNHSYSHRDLNNTPLRVYEADVVRGELVTRRLLQARGKRLRYFRHPFLHAGKTTETKVAFEKFLAGRGYTIAPVTIDNQEWVFAEVYAAAKHRRDEVTAKRVADSYIVYMNSIFDFFEKRSIEVTGREIRQVLLLHANPLNADYLDELVLMMKKRGYTFISLDRALADPAYRLPDKYAGPVGLSWLHRWALTKGLPMREEPREPAFIAKLFERHP